MNDAELISFYYKNYEKVADTLRVLANLDGCEGGDFLFALASVYEVASYSSEEAIVVLSKLAWNHSSFMFQQMLSVQAEYLGYAPEEVNLTISAIDRIWSTNE